MSLWKSKVTPQAEDAAEGTPFNGSKAKDLEALNAQPPTPPARRKWVRVAGFSLLTLVVLGVASYAIWMQMKVVVEFIEMKPPKVGQKSLTTDSLIPASIPDLLFEQSVEGKAVGVNATVAVSPASDVCGCTATEMQLEVRSTVRRGSVLFEISIAEITFENGKPTHLEVTLEKINIPLFTELCGGGMLVRRLDVELSGSAKLDGWRRLLPRVSIASQLGNIPCIPPVL
jgi:hypothetical protein